MSDTITFDDLLLRCRNGDQQAIAELVRQYEPIVQAWARSRSRALDPESVCQSVLKSLFARLSDGQDELPTPTHLEKLLSVMARNKAYDRLRKKRLPMEPDSANALLKSFDPSASPDEIALAHDLRERILELLAPADRRVLELRIEMIGWKEIAVALGESEACLRMRLTRALENIASRLGLKVKANHDG